MCCDALFPAPLQCKALGNVVLGEVFANTLCNSVLPDFKDTRRGLGTGDLAAVLPS